MWGGVLGPTRRWTWKGALAVTSVVRRRVFDFSMITLGGSLVVLIYAASRLHLARHMQHGMRSVIVDRASPSSMQSACNQHALVDHPHRPSERR